MVRRMPAPRLETSRRDAECAENKRVGFLCAVASLRENRFFLTRADLPDTALLCPAYQWKTLAETQRARRINTFSFSAPWRLGESSFFL